MDKEKTKCMHCKTTENLASFKKKELVVLLPICKDCKQLVKAKNKASNPKKKESL